MGQNHQQADYTLIRGQKEISRLMPRSLFSPRNNPMDPLQIEHYRSELQSEYPDAQIKVAPDQREMVAELSGERAIAIIERSQPHFHTEITEAYRVLRGTLLVARAGMGFVLQVGENITITPGQIHHAQALGDPAWIEVLCDPAWRADDHLVLS
jgi:mannose-6-phosphate isomerase-like protein (cupin superfamily)